MYTYRLISVCMYWSGFIGANGESKNTTSVHIYVHVSSMFSFLLTSLTHSNSYQNNRMERLH